MRDKYYAKVKDEFFSTSNAEKYVEGIAHLVSELTSPTNSKIAEDILAVAYVLHKNFIANFFQLYGSDNKPELLSKFAIAYAALLEHFSNLEDENKDDATFKKIILDLLNEIIKRDDSNQLALTLALKLVNSDLSPELCLTALTQANVTEPESQQKIMDILGSLYNKDVFWNKASNSPGMAFSITPTTPQTMAVMMYQEATKHCSRHAHNANISFLFYMQSCWYRAGNVHGCHFIDMCLPIAVASMNMYKEKIPEWRWLLQTLGTYPNDSMQQRWRNRIIQNIHTQYNDAPELLDRLGVNRSSWCTSWTWLFNRCRGEESLEGYESKPVVKGRKFVLSS